jgi:hypothetical protein
LEQLEGAPGFMRELDNLRRYWQDDEDEQARLDETLRVMKKYPAAWRMLQEAGLAKESRPSTAMPPPAEPPPVAPLPPVAQERAVEKPRPLPETTQSPPQPGERSALYREIITSIVGALIVVTTMVVVLLSVFFPGGSDNQESARNALSFLYSMLGVVLGYYFGRAPGDAHAAQAASEAKAASRQSQEMAHEVRSILEGASPADSRRGGDSQSLNLSPLQLERLRRLAYQY